ncbi:MAG TPA: hypothetical protein ENJ95_18785 [Bacteroidetes bacterium]|nr:hypothetical protein [Bacteroidota bacterium]
MKYLIFIFTFYLSISLFSQDMTVAKMGAIFKKEAAEIEDQGGVWHMTYRGRLLLVVTDTDANRMRIFTPIMEAKDLLPGQKEKMLSANFDSALDAKYSVYQGFVMSVFTHPLKELYEPQLVDAMKQVAVLAETFGTSYQSTDMVFGGATKSEEPKINQSPGKEKKN